MGQYLGDLADSRRGKISSKPDGGMLAAFVNDSGPDGQFTRPELMATAVLLLIALTALVAAFALGRNAGAQTAARQPEAWTQIPIPPLPPFHPEWPKRIGGGRVGQE